MRLRWAKSISTFFRSFIEILYCLVLAISRATWRASSLHRSWRFEPAHSAFSSARQLTRKFGSIKQRFPTLIMSNQYYMLAIKSVRLSPRIRVQVASFTPRTCGCNNPRRRIELVADGIVDGQKPLHRSWRFEPAHSAFSSARRLTRKFGSIIQSPRLFTSLKC